MSDDQPGYTRKSKGDDFEYFDTDGKPIRDETRLLRIRRLAIPPAYKDVWICPSPNGHIQATARDARGRKQYRYHQRWREARDENKYDRMLVFGQALPKIRRQVNKDMGARDLPRNKVLATVVHLLGRTFIRIGNEEYARENQSFGLTTMRDRHVDVKGATLRFTFRGKSGVKHEIDVNDRRLANILRKLQDLPGQDIFQYEDESGEVRNVTSQDVNDYLREITGEEFTAKDFRTWAGTVLTAMALNAQGPAENEDPGKKEHQRCDRGRFKNSRQHACHLPEMLCPSRGARNLPRWRHDRRPQAKNRRNALGEFGGFAGGGSRRDVVPSGAIGGIEEVSPLAEDVRLTCTLTFLQRRVQLK